MKKMKHVLAIGVAALVAMQARFRWQTGHGFGGGGFGGHGFGVADLVVTALVVGVAAGSVVVDLVARV
jgi:hypothetical protein